MCVKIYTDYKNNIRNMNKCRCFDAGHEGSMNSLRSTQIVGITCYALQSPHINQTEHLREILEQRSRHSSHLHHHRLLVTVNN